MIRLIRSIALGAVVAVVAACISPTATTSPGSPAVSPGTSGAALQLRRAAAGTGCDTIGIDYREATFHIDPAADDPVTATADTGTNLRTFWSPGFQGSAADKTVSDPGGTVVVTDGQVLPIPEGAYPRLGGYFVCLAPDALYILADDPA